MKIGNQNIYRYIYISLTLIVIVLHFFYTIVTIV
jgi:hypothetical protein